MAGDEQKSLAAGMNDHVTKPGKLVKTGDLVTIRSAVGDTRGGSTSWLPTRLGQYRILDLATHGAANDAGETEPLGVEVKHTTWSYNTETSPNESTTIYIEYIITNKGNNTLKDLYLSFWVDADLGSAGNDLVGCDTLDDLFFTYNGDNYDTYYSGGNPPAIGFKVIHGPVVYSEGDSAYFDGEYVQDYKNLGLTSFTKYINGTDPDNYQESYNYMKGLNRDGNPIANGTNYAVPGDPVAGTGDLDVAPSDRRMMGGFGPITMRPGDSQYLLLKMAVGQGGDYLSSITELKNILNTGVLSPPMLKTEIQPNPMYQIMNNAIDYMPCIVKVGYDAEGMIGKTINFNSVNINGINSFDSVVYANDVEGFAGTVGIYYFPIGDFLDDYGLLFDTTQQQYSITGVYDSKELFEITGNVTLIGHISGDFNFDGQVDITDLVMLVNYSFAGGVAPVVPEAIDLDHDGQVTISDLVALVRYMFSN